jgi:PAS domain S-box-containing protein
MIDALSHGATYYIRKCGDPKTLFAELASKIREVSLRCRTDNAAKETELRYRIFLEYSDIPVVLFDNNLVITASSSGFRDLTGYKKSEIEGVLRLPDLIPDNDDGDVAGTFRLFPQGSLSPVRQKTSCLVTKDHRVRSIQATISLIPGTSWGIASIIDVAHSPWGGGSMHEMAWTPRTVSGFRPDALNSQKQFVPWMARMKENHGPEL